MTAIPSELPIKRPLNRELCVANEWPPIVEVVVQLMKILDADFRRCTDGIRRSEKAMNPTWFVESL